MKRQFVWDAWDYDCDGEAYIIAKDACPKREDVQDFICREDGIHSECKSEMQVQEGWCRKVGAAGKSVRTGKVATGSRKVGIAYTTVRYLGLSLFGLCVKKNGIDSYTIVA